jgi:integrase
LSATYRARHITSHVIRKTTATMLDQAGLSARAIADQLRHANPSLTQDVYLGRQVASTGAALALEALRSNAGQQ